MTKQLVFIDDSGDPGFQPGISSSVFILAAALFVDEKSATALNKAISDYRQSLNWKPEHEFKFRKASKRVKLEFLKIASQYGFEIYAVYINKSNYPNVFNFTDDEKLYNWTTKELLKTMPLQNASVKMDGKYTREYRKHIKTYIRKELNNNGKNVIKDFRIADSSKDNLIQLADIIVGSIHRFIVAEKTDSREYINTIKSKIVELKELDLLEK